MLDLRGYFAGEKERKREEREGIKGKKRGQEREGIKKTPQRLPRYF